MVIDSRSCLVRLEGKMLKLFSRRFFIFLLIFISQRQLGSLGKRSQNNLLRTLSFLSKSSSWHDNSTDKQKYVKQPKQELKFENSVILDSHKRFHLYWNFDNILEEVTFEIVAKIKRDQFFAFGFSDYGEFINADYGILWTDNSGKSHFQVSKKQQILFIE